MGEVRCPSGFVPGGPREGGKSEAETEVVNTPPSLVSVQIKPGDLRAGMDLSADVEGYDADGDPLRYDFLWSVNGLSFFNEALREPLEVDAVAAGNSPPYFVSSPPAGFSKHFIYEVMASDPDGDEITYAVMKGPKGMEMKGSRIEWEPVGDEGQADVAVSADDGRGGSALQSFRLTIGKEKGDGQSRV